jgi:hypothetical protein
MVALMNLESADDRPNRRSRPIPTLLQRETFRTSRLIEFCNQKELVAQTGDPAETGLS